MKFLTNAQTRILSVLAVSSLFGCAVVGNSPGSSTNLPVSSPDWRDQIIYFVLTGRFNDGDASNNDQGAGVYDPTDHRRYSGGDLRGIEQKLDYLSGLGATAVWITPPVANQWYDTYVDYGGYHGYWARDFMSVDEHYGTLEDYKSLSQALHDRDMYLIQDIVLNHTGNYTYYDKNKYNPDDVCQHFNLNQDTPPTASASQSPLDMNDACNSEHREAAIYNFTPVIDNYNDPEQTERYQLADLDDLNTENPVVRSLLKSSYRYWIEEVGVDGFRVDTAKYVSHDMLHDFFHSEDGVLTAARALGKDDFFAFGEIWDYSQPYDDDADRKLASYLGSDSKPELPSVINFPLQGTLRNVFASGAPTSELAYRLKTLYEVYPDPTRLVNFLDNHDMDRFRKIASLSATRQALTALFTLPGIPVIYQGTELEFVGQRDALFADGFGSQGIDHFSNTGGLYDYIAELAQVRKSNKALTHGSLTVLAEDTDKAGIFAYVRQYNDERLLVLFNTASHALLANDLTLGLEANQKLPIQFSSHPIDLALVTNSKGNLTVALPAHGSLILDLTATEAVPESDWSIASFGFLTSRPLTADQTFKGMIQDTSITDLQLVINQNLDRALPVAISENGQNFTATLPIDYFPVGDSDNTYTIYAPQTGASTPTVAFKTSIEFSAEEVLNTLRDPNGDDIGAGYPLDVTFEDRQMDISEVTVARSDLYLDITIKPSAITTYWSPQNGFDHVRFNIHFDLPTHDYNETVLPFIQSSMPHNHSWDLLAVVDGWNNAVYWANDAGPEAFGTTASPAPSVRVNKAEGSIKLRFDASLFGKTRDISGGQIYITTWDYDGVGGIYRPIKPAGGPFVMQGPDASAPYIMDDLLIAIP